jgi:hypothetical protein
VSWPVMGALWCGVLTVSRGGETGDTRGFLYILLDFDMKLTLL